MNFLEERILKDGVVKEGNVLKVDSFLNHQMDIDLFDQMGEEFKKRFAGKKINKILTIEASGIGIACIVARHFNVPVVFAKKSKSIRILSSGERKRFDTRTWLTHLWVKDSTWATYVSPSILMLFDFLANGCALRGLISIIENAGATVSGIGIAIEKGFQRGGKEIREAGYQIESLAIVEEMDAKNGTVTFR